MQAPAHNVLVLTCLRPSQRIVLTLRLWLLEISDQVV
eukprot:COSAG06_NODE_57803_length_279_cov_0.577778_1_plen_36_part_01